MATFDEALNGLSVEVASEVLALTARAGTYDADWEILKSAGEETAKLRGFLRQYITATSEFNMDAWLQNVRGVTEDFDIEYGSLGKPNAD